MFDIEPTQPRIPGMGQDLRVIITASAAGIGRVMADSSMINGARVVVSDISPDAVAAFSEAHPDHLALQSNAANE